MENPHFDLQNVIQGDLLIGGLVLFFGFWYLALVDAPVWWNALLYSSIGAVIIGVSLVLLVFGLITKAGIITASCIAIINSTFLYLSGKNGTGEELGDSYIKTTYTLAMVVTGLIPVLFLILSTINYTGLEHFLTGRMIEFIWTEVVALFYITLAAVLYRKNRGEAIDAMIRRSLLSMLTLSFGIRLFWISIMETRHIVRFSEQYPQFFIEYVVLISIPLFIALFVMSLFKLRVAFRVSVGMGILHVILVSFLVVMSINSGFGPIIVIASSLGISTFSILELRKNQANVAANLASRGAFKSN